MTLSRILLFTGLSLLTGPLQAAPPERGDLRSPRFHDPSTPILEGENWYVFSTGNGIVCRTSPDLRTWSDGGPVFKEMPAWHREIVSGQKGHLWAPDIIRRGDRFLLYYSVSSWGKNVSAIGLASNTTLDPKNHSYQWKDEGIIVRSNDKDPYNAIDPQLFADPDGSLWMTFGSFWGGIQLIELDPKTGLRHPERGNVRQLAWNKTIEAPALLKHGKFYYLFVNWGLCCRGLDSTYEIRVGRSEKVTGPYQDRDGNELATGGGSLFLGSEGDRVGPGHPSFVPEKTSTRIFFHYYDRQRAGMATLGHGSLRWREDGWPEFSSE